MRTTVLCISAIAWIVLFAVPDSLTVPVICSVPAAGIGLTADAVDLALAINPPAAVLTHWAWMLAAMMGPLLVQPLQRVAPGGSVPRRAGRTAAFVGGYLVVWLPAGSALSILAVILAMQGPAPTIFAAAFLAALAWEAGSVKRRCLDACRSSDIDAARQTSADLLRAGCRHGTRCVGSCWALMLACLLAPGGHWAGMAVMAATSVWILWERRGQADAPRRWSLAHDRTVPCASMIPGPLSMPSPTAAPVHRRTR